MRVLIATGDVGRVPADVAGVVIGQAFEEEGAQVAVVGLQGAVPAASSVDAFVALLGAGERVVDVRGLEFRPEDTDAVRSALGDRAVTLVVDDAEVSLPCTGLSGAAVARSRARGEDLAAGLEADRAAAQWLETHGLQDAPGAGAAGGLGALVLDAGGGVVDLIGHHVERSGITRTAGAADLLVTGCTSLDFHARGGPLVARVVALGESALRPVIVLTGHNFVSSRELRLAGIEDAYAVHPGPDGDVDEAALRALAARVARTWRP